MNENQNFSNMPENQPNTENGYAIACMILGIISCVMLLSYGALWSIITGIISLVLGCIARKKHQTNGFRQAGIICGIIGTTIGTIFIIITIASMLFTTTIFNNIKSYGESAVNEILTSQTTNTPNFNGLDKYINTNPEQIQTPNTTESEKQSEQNKQEEYQQQEEPEELREFREIQKMDFDTYFATYYTMIDEETGWTHQYRCNLTNETWDYFDIYKLWEEITKNNYAAYLAMYDSSDRSWENGDAANYQLPDKYN